MRRMAVLRRIVASWAKHRPAGSDKRMWRAAGGRGGIGASADRAGAGRTSAGRTAARRVGAGAARVVRAAWRLLRWALRRWALRRLWLRVLRRGRAPGEPIDPRLPATAQIVAVQHPSMNLPERPYDLLLLGAVLGLLGIGTI